MSRGLLWNWWQQVRTGVLSPEAMPVFMPVQVTREAAPERAPLALRGPGPGNSVEVSLGFLAQLADGCSVLKRTITAVLGMTSAEPVPEPHRMCWQPSRTLPYH